MSQEGYRLPPSAIPYPTFWFEDHNPDGLHLGIFLQKQRKRPEIQAYYQDPERETWARLAGICIIDTVSTFRDGPQTFLKLPADYSKEQPIHMATFEVMDEYQGSSVEGLLMNALLTWLEHKHSLHLDIIGDKGDKRFYNTYLQPKGYQFTAVTDFRKEAASRFKNRFAWVYKNYRGLDSQ